MLTTEASAREWLLKRFLSLRLPGYAPDDHRTLVFGYLAEKYGEPHRKYHTLGHVDFCFKVFDEFRHLAKDSDALVWAILFHDLHYDIGVPARQNEEASAFTLVRQMLMWKCNDDCIFRAMSAVLATTHDHTPSTNDNRLIVDIDLAGLGAPWPVFLENNQNIRQEYKDVPEEAFRKGNGAVLKRFLDRKPLYYHPEIEAKYGDQARDNLTRWLNRP